MDIQLSLALIDWYLLEQMGLLLLIWISHSSYWNNLAGIQFIVSETSWCPVRGYYGRKGPPMISLMFSSCYLERPWKSNRHSTKKIPVGPKIARLTGNLRNMLLEPQRRKPLALRSCALLRLLHRVTLPFDGFHSTATARKEIIVQHSLLGGMQREFGIYVAFLKSCLSSRAHILGWLENFLFVERQWSRLG
jgi:hypothetical protein